MYAMKKLQLVLVGAMLVGASSVAIAQEPQPQPQPQQQGRPNMMATLMQGITLSAEQQSKVDSITKKYADERQTLMADQSLDRDARRAKMREAMAKQSDEIKAILTDDQKKVFEKNQADLQARMQQGGGRPPR
jgi:Spy/CpxP family protein refolding chaperone